MLRGHMTCLKYVHKTNRKRKLNKYTTVHQISSKVTCCNKMRRALKIEIINAPVSFVLFVLVTMNNRIKQLMSNERSSTLNSVASPLVFR